MSAPTYPLELVKHLIGSPRRIITRTSQLSAGELGLDEQDIVECIAALSESSFYKSMPAEKRPGTWQDVYRTTFAGFDLYVKVQIIDTSPDDIVVVISFKRSTTV